LNGRRVETSGAQGFSDFFDLNNIPLAAVDRIEVLANGSSAIYGSDAIAGVVNVILRKDFDGVQASVTYGGASGIDEADANLAWGKEWDKGSVSIIGSYQTRGELTASERSITSSLDFTRFGGPNNNFPECSPGNVYSIDGITPLPGLGIATFAAVPAGFHGTPSIQEFSATAGIQNECNLLASESLIPATRRFGVFAQANYEITPSIELFAELMYSHVQQYNEANYQGLFGEPFFQFFTVSASNPYNPFGTAVGVSDLFTSLPREGTISGTNFVRPLVGARGSFLDSWHWELSAWESADFDKQTNPLLNADNAAIQNALNSSNPATALNPFVAGPSDAQQQQLISSFFTDGHSTYLGREQSINGFVRGPLFSLPSGPVEVVLGGEYDRGTLMQDNIDLYYLPPNSRATYHRDSYALFGEARIPLIANHSDPDAGDVLAVTIAGRHDHFDDFGSADTPQVGAEWRPWDELLVRATYSDAFKAPTLFQLHTPQSASTGIGVVDPTTGQSVSVTVIGGGNPNLRAETGRSYTYGFVYSSKLIPNLRLSITHWNVDENDSIQNLSPQFIVNNESLFRGDVIRNSAGMITQVNDTFVNFGQIDVAGLDYELSYLYQSEVGDWSPSVDFTQTYQYSAALVPGSAPTQRAGKASDDGAWAPRWKGTVGLGWKLGPFSANLDGRYVGSYQDYDSTRIIGNFWFFDGSLRYAIGKVLSPDNQNTSGVYVQIGGVNLFNELPQFSNYQSDFVGYDPTQADIRGRFLYVQIGTNL
ncbi:MAG: TonB-dependent receptor, partial [Alphaproteobacteria bacterium]|nr:TonB-dependent receptor [Alphaproteobacteria bacterium]